jgi:hypothetical protein
LDNGLEGLMNIPSNEPTELRAGVRWDWTRDLTPDIDASAGWTLTYYFKKLDGLQNFSFAATASGKLFSVARTAANTQALIAGDYSWVAVASNGADLREVDNGKLKVLPRYDQAANLDDRSHARKVLDALKAVIEARATTTQRELVGFTIGSRSQQFDNQETKMLLLEFKSRYEWLVFEEENAAGLKRGEANQKVIKVGFNPA